MHHCWDKIYVRFFAFIIVILGGTATPAVAQPDHLTFEVRLSYGIATYDMGDLPAWQQAQLESLRSELNVPVKIVDEFPAQFAFRGDILLYEKIPYRVGITAGYSSTGGRVHYADYSGSLRFDQIVSRTYGGGLVETRLTGGTSTLSLWAAGRLLIVGSTIKAKQVIEVQGSPQSSEIELTSPGLGFLPTLAVEWERKIVSARLYGGYELFVEGGLKSSRSGQFLSSIGDNEDPTLSWAGLRAGLSASILIPELIRVIKGEKNEGAKPLR